jgi:glyoxylate/hydroxypyruvate reductase A
MGMLGKAALLKLSEFGFPCAGWSRSPQHIQHVDCFNGMADLPAFLARSDILICLLPLTKDTRGILNGQLFSLLPAGAAIINVGRGAHCVQEDLLAALESGQISQAVLDVCDPEPLPKGHWLWSHPRVTLTPHIASMTQPQSAVTVVLNNIYRHEQGLAMHGVVDRERGY